MNAVPWCSKTWLKRFFSNMFSNTNTTGLSQLVGSVIVPEPKITGSAPKPNSRPSISHEKQKGPGKNQPVEQISTGCCSV